MKAVHSCPNGRLLNMSQALRAGEEEEEEEEEGEGSATKLQMS